MIISQHFKNGGLLPTFWLIQNYLMLIPFKFYLKLEELAKKMNCMMLYMLVIK